MSKLLDELKWIDTDYENAVNYLLYETGQDIAYIIPCADQMYQEEIDKIIENMKCSYLRVKNAIQKFCKDNPEYISKGGYGIDIEAPSGNNTMEILTNRDFRAFLENN